MNPWLDFAIDVGLDVLLQPVVGHGPRRPAGQPLSAGEKSQAENQGQQLVHRGRHSLRKAEALIAKARRDLARGEHLLARARSRPLSTREGLGASVSERAEFEGAAFSKSH
jgi:hypothetical protein